METTPRRSVGTPTRADTSADQSRPREAQPVTVDQLHVGDRITEVETPEGPWFVVLGLDRESVTIEGRVDDHEASLPVTIGYGPRGTVLRRPARP